MNKVDYKTIRNKEIMMLGILSLFCFSASLFRVISSGTRTYLFLNWNLFLAFIPWLLTTWVMKKPKLQKSKPALFVLLGSWLLFFPNAPYILTDIFHIKYISSMPIWFDLILIMSFAWTGLLFGFFSLMDMEKVLQNHMKKTYVSIVSVSLLFITSFGIYIGRFLRWNSWDIITEPMKLLRDMGDRLVNPFEHPRTWGMTIFMGLFLNMVYWSFRFMRIRNE